MRTRRNDIRVHHRDFPSNHVLCHSPPSTYRKPASQSQLRMTAIPSSLLTNEKRGECDSVHATSESVGNATTKNQITSITHMRCWLVTLGVIRHTSIPYEITQS